MQYNTQFQGFFCVSSNLYFLGFFEESWQFIAIIEVYDVTMLLVRHFLMN